MGTMMSEGFLEYASGRLAVSPEVKATLPNVLIDFLWNIVLCEKWKTHENQTLILEVGELSGEKVQDIYHADDFEDSAETRRIFGIEPVNCKLLVLHSQDSYKMLLCGS